MMPALSRTRSWRLLAVGAGMAAIVRFATTGCSHFGAGADDTPTGDSGVDGDVPSSEAGSGDASARPCDAALCTDFDPPSDTVPFGWDRVGNDVDAGGRFVLLPGEGRSPPNALRLAADVTGGFEGSLYLEKVLGAPSELSLSFAMRVEALAMSGARAGRVVEVVCGNKTIARVKINASGRLFVDGVEQGIEVSAGALPPNTWQTVRFHLSGLADADGGLVTATLVETNETNPPSVAAPCSADLRLRVGLIVEDEGAGKYVFALDDIVADWR